MTSAHEHDHDPVTDTRKAFAWAVAFNSGFVVVEAAFGFATGSLALLADAAHNLTDVAGLLVAWGAVSLSRRRPSIRHTYGLGRATILAALANAIAILAGVGAVVWEAVHRLSEPTAVAAGTVLWVAALGIFVNTGTALLFLKDRHHDLNSRGAFLHMATDAAVSAGVVVSAIIILVTGWLIVDPVAAILVSALVGWSAFDLFRSAIHLSLDGVPKDVDVSAVAQWLRTLPNVSDVHDLHIWPLSTTTVALTAHLVMPQTRSGDAFLETASAELRVRFGIDHATLQVEDGDGRDCRLAPEEVV